jgi:hypothetical protein
MSTTYSANYSPVDPAVHPVGGAKSTQTRRLLTRSHYRPKGLMTALPPKSIPAAGPCQFVRQHRNIFWESSLWNALSFGRSALIACGRFL